MEGELWKINKVDFIKYVLANEETITQLVKNLSTRFETIKQNEENRHDEFKFHNVPGK